MVSHLIKLVNVVNLRDEVLVGFVEPLQVAALNVKRELFVLVDRSMTHLVHLVKLTLEHNEVTAFLGLSVDHTSFELLEGIDDFEEVSVIEEEAKVFRLRLLDNCFNGEEQCVLVKVRLEVGGSVRCQSTEIIRAG